MDLSIIIVNYYSDKVLFDCLQSIFEDNYNDRLEVILVNNSPDDSNLTKILSTFKKVRKIEAGYNAGFARANNLGIENASGRYILLLNSDTVLPPEIMDYFINWMDAHPTYAMCGTKLVYPDGTPQISGNYVLSGGLNYLLMIPFVGKIIKAIAIVSGVRKTNLMIPADEFTDVDWINGAFLFVRKFSIEKAGTLDPDFFLYHEESEWCSRLLKTGKAAILSKFQVIHMEGYSSQKEFKSKTIGHNNLFDKKGQQLFLSMLVRFRKEFSLAWMMFHLVAFTLSIPLVLLFGIIVDFFNLATSRPLRVVDYVRYSKNVLSSWYYLPHLVKNRPFFYKVI